jgi:adenosine kinase
MSKQYDVVTSGYVSMDRIVKIKTPASVGFTSLIENKTCADIYYGGCSVNIAYNLCRLGIVTMPIMRVGDDYEKIGFKDFLYKAGIPMDALTVVPNERTSICYLLQNNQGQHITLFYPGAMNGNFAAPMDDCIFKNTRLGVMTVGSRADNEEFFKMCVRYKLPLVFSMKGDMDAFPKDFLRSLLFYCRIIFTNECERQAIEEIFNESILILLDKGNAEIIVTTFGRDGSRCYSRTRSGIKEDFVPICDLGPPKDTTGSGDAYVSGFLYGYLKKKVPRECAMLGTVLSSFVIEKEGCCTGAPNKDSLIDRYRQFSDQCEGVQ